MNTKQLEQALNNATNQLAHDDNVQYYRKAFHKLSKEAFADDVRVEYMVHDQGYTEANRKAKTTTPQVASLELVA